MPSLEQLEEFKSSFKDIGNEALIMANNQLPLEDFELPGNEPAEPFPGEWAQGPDPGAMGADTLNLDELGLDRPADSFPDIADPVIPPLDDSGAGFDFGDLLGSIPDAAEPGLPEDLLSGFADDLESGGLPTDDTLPESAVPEDLSVPEELSVPEDLSMPEELSEPEDLSIPEDLSAPEEPEALDLEAPEAEPSPAAPPPESAETEFANLEFPDIDLTQTVDMGGETRDTPEEAAEAGTELSGPADDFGDFNLDGLDTAGTAPEAPGFDAAPDAGFDTPDLDTAALDTAGPETDDPGAAADFDTPDFDAGDFGDGLDLGGETAEGADPGGPDPGAADFDTPDFDTPDFDAGDFGDGLDLGGETAEGPAANAAGTETADAETDGAGDFGDGLDLPGFDAPLDLGGETDAFNLGGEADEGALDADGGGADEFPDLPGDLSGGTDESAEAGAGDSFDGFSLGGEDWKPPEETLDTPDFAAPSGGEGDFDDFSLAGFDDAFAEPGKAGPGKAGPAKAGTPGRAAGPLPAADEVEEIRLSEGDFKRLQETLSAYPLNLRIACEELIAVEAVAPDLMSSLIKLLVRGAPAKETAALAGKILGRTIPIPKGYAKKTGAELEEEQASFGYIFVRRFLPVLRLVGAIALVIASLAYLTWRFVVVPLQAESLYKEGFVMLKAGEYTQANEQFRLALEKRRVKNWFYRYAEGFRDERQYIYAERKYDELLRVYPRDKKGALDYAGMETNYLKNYEKADRIIRDHILDWAVNDRDGLLALAENNLAWGETEPARYEDARAAYARLMEQYGRLDPYLEGMLKYFIRTDQLAEVLRLQSHFMGDPKKRKITVPTLAELGGYLLDKRFEEAHGVPLEEPPAVPEEYADQIEGIRDVLERAVKADGTYPESYYHLARYYNRYGSSGEERQSLRDALRNFAAAREETPRRAAYRVDAHRRYAEVLINAGEFFPAEEELIRGVRLYEDARARQVLKTGPEFGRLYADLGDLEFFVKNGDMTAALRFYEEGERNGWAPPEIQYRMGAAHYQNEEWEAALGRFFLLSSVMPDNRRLLYALGNTSYLRGNYFAAQGYYNRLMDLLAAGRVRFPSIAPGSRPEEQDLAERIMVVNNNLGVTLEALTRISGDTGYRGRALGLFSESIRAWDILTRNPESMSRMRPFKDLYGPGVNLAYLNAQNILRPEPGYEQQIFMRIDRDALEPSPWELLAPRDYRLSDQMMPMPVE